MDYIGLKGRKEVEVTDANTARALSPDLAPVFSTPDLLALIEDTCRGVVAPYLDEDQSTVGTKVLLEHMSATPVGMKVWCEAEIIEAEGKRFLFSVEAFDEAGKVADCKHERYIIRNESFINRANQKLQDAREAAVRMM